MEKRPTHILVECPELIASVRVGVLNAISPLEEKQICQSRFRETRNIKKEDLAWCDILICVRGSEEMTFRIVREAKRLGRVVFYFLDDDLLGLPTESLAYDYFQYGDHQRALRLTLALCDGLWGANTLIRDAYLPLCGIKRWICTRMPIRIEVKKDRPQRKKIRVLYAGSVDHQNIVRGILTRAIELVLEKCGDRVDFTFVGPKLDMKEHQQVHFQPFFEDYDEYRKYVTEGDFQIGLAPTKLDKFYQCKYYNKFVEYTSIGAVGVYTDCPLYQQVVSTGENGLLCENTPEAWAEAIIRLSEEKELRRQCYEKAAMLIDSEFRPEQVGNSLLAQVPEFRDYRALCVSRNQVRLASPMVYFYLSRTRYLFRQYHLLAIPVIIWKAVKKITLWIFRRKKC